MLRDIVSKQKGDKDRLLSLSYVEREKIKKAKEWLDSDLIKVVLGPRMAGKSVFSLMLLNGLDFLYFNFDDEGLPVRKEFDYDGLMKELHFAYGKTKIILFDEIQNLPKWELFVSRLHREGYNMILTGSNANLLSRELATALTGRHIPIEIMPFNFQEFLKAKNYAMSLDKMSLPEEKAKLLKLAHNYFLSGGFPEVVVKELDSGGYLSVLFDSLLFKDVVKRHKVKLSEQIGNLGAYLMNNAANLYSLRKLTNALGFNSGITLEKYLRYLIDAYLVFSLRCYSVKVGKRIKSPQKIYAVDNGFITAKAVQHSPDSGKLFENFVFMELVKRGLKPNQDLFYYKTRNDREVDFVLKEGIKVQELIQAAYGAKDELTEEREIKALLEASGELGAEKLTVLSWDEEKELEKNGKTIFFTPFWKWATVGWLKQKQKN